MARYRYTALSRSGRTQRGLVEAGSTEEAINALAARGESAVSLRPTGATAETRIPRTELASFLGDLAALHDAGVPLRRALDVLSSGASTRHASSLARLMSERLDAGADLSGAADLNEGGDLSLAAELVRAGEASGRLSETLRFAAELLQRQADFSKRIASALAYPLFLVALSAAALVALAAFAGPAIAPLLEDSPGDSGGLRMVLVIGNGLRKHGALITAVIVALATGFVVLSRRQPLRGTLAHLRANLPVSKDIVRDINCGTYARTLGALLAGGAPAAAAIDLAARTAPNLHWKDKFALAGERLRDGRTVATALGSVSGLSPELTRLARVGEASGALGDMLTRAGNIAVERALRRLDQSAAAAGPILILVMGGFTGWLMSTFLTGLSSLGDPGL